MHDSRAKEVVDVGIAVSVGCSESSMSVGAAAEPIGLSQMIYIYVTSWSSRHSKFPAMTMTNDRKTTRSVNNNCRRLGTFVSKHGLNCRGACLNPNLNSLYVFENHWEKESNDGMVF